MISKLLPAPHRLAAAALLFVSAQLFAQTATTPPASDTTILDPFTVTASEDRGYTASETMTGSRVKTKIIDLPYSVNVMTSEFLADFGIFELSDNLTHISGFTGLDVGGNFILRGFTSSNQLRDGFFRLGRYGTSNIDRIEIIKGSSAAIYGRSSPGGMMNMISKQPKPAANQKLTFNYGDYGTQRVTLEATGPLFQDQLGKTNYILAASYNQRDFAADYALARNKEYYLAVDHVFADGSKLTLMAEDFYQQRQSPLAPSPLIIDKKGTGTSTTLDADDRAIGYALNLGRYSAYGPTSHLNRGNTSFTGIYEKNINSVFSGRISGNMYMARRDDYNQNNNWGTILINKANTVAPFSQRGATPNWGRIFEDGGGVQADLLAHYFSNDRKMEHRTLLTFDFNDYYRWDPTISYAASTNADIVAWATPRSVTVDANYNPTGPIAYFTKDHDPVNGYVSTRKMDRRTTVIGGLLRHQTALMNGRLLAYAGARYDTVRYRHRDYLTAASSFTPFIPGYVAGDLIDKKLSAFKPNMGLNYKIKENFRVFANYSQSYFIAQGDNPVEVANPTYKAEIADGWDYGFKGSLLNDRLSYTVSGFYINRENVSVADIDEITGLSVQRRDGNQLVRGFELDATWSITDEFFLMGSYGDVDSIYTDFGSAFPQAIGRKVQFVAPYNGSLSLKYAPSHGRLKGFSANIGVTFVGETPTEPPNAGDTMVTVAGKPTVSFSSGQWALTAPAYSIWSAGVRYTTATKSNVSHTFAINVNNVSDEQYYKAGTSGATRILHGDNRSIFFTYTVNHKGTKF